MTITDDSMQLNPGDEVIHQRYGPGVIEFPKGTTAIVRFEHGLEECDALVLKKLVSLESALESNDWHSLREVVTKCQAAAIQSVNDSWGVFSRSRISLLPHQLWVCHRVSRRWPIRYLVADDVGLGKTIEAGLLLWPLISKGLVRRLLVLCPAALVEQWQYRLREMFDIRLARYSAESDSKKGDFWNTHHQVVASLPTLRADRNGRHERMLNAEPWDLLIVDEAHHLNSDESTGSTLGYKFVESLLEKQKVESCVFFSGTPHRGKSYGFWSLMALLRPDLFDPKQPDHQQIVLLKEVMIRNNKSLVTDMQGQKLFKPVSVYSETYSYQPEEEAFYTLLTEFIESGKAYASSLTAREGGQVMLVLIAMQKLASSSVAAIRKALQGRLGRLRDTQKELQETIRLSAKEKAALFAADDESSLLADQENDLDLMLAEATLTLMEAEIPNLQSLVEAASAVESETKIEKILDVLEGRYKDRQVLFFTEYKSTQSLLIAALMRKYGEKCVTFINGDERLYGLLFPDGSVATRHIPRGDAADLFNAGKVRFLVSTEAGGEGIDLQDKCHSLIHVDLPWNPMRLHQRVGRLNRYGQKQPVEVITLRNPATVEARIWDLLNAKLERITSALSGAMDDPEDLLQLVLGMSSSGIFTELFSEGQLSKKGRLDQWFDERSETLGGQSAIDAVKAMVGNADRFDLSGLKDVPNVDLPHLRFFFENMLTAERRRVSRVGDFLTFKTPENWLDEPGMRRKYEDMVFDRNVPTGRAEKVLGVGHIVFDKALKTASEYPVSLAASKNIKSVLFVYQIIDSITEQSGRMRRSIVGVEHGGEGEYSIVRDWEVLEKLNSITDFDSSNNNVEAGSEAVRQHVEFASNRVESWIKLADLPFRVPAYRVVAAIVPV
tara:strand:- start:12012 stop:14693 length:2682 start_codon:yes stop_codon:yes gene_type:complete